MNAIELPSFIKKQPVAVACALLCVVLAVVIYFRKDTLAAAQAELEDKTSRASHLKENVDSATSINKADRLDEQLATMKQATQAIEARLLHVNQLAINKQYFYKLESETQTRLTGLNQSGVRPAGRNSAYVAVGYSVNVEGTYAQLLDFVRRVENGEHFSRVQALSISPSGGGNASLSLRLELLGLP
jgi:Tfp pilus assembly protein PilO